MKGEDIVDYVLLTNAVKVEEIECLKNERCGSRRNAMYGK